MANTSTHGTGGLMHTVLLGTWNVCLCLLHSLVCTGHAMCDLVLISARDGSLHTLTHGSIGVRTSHTSAHMMSSGVMVVASHTQVTHAVLLSAWNVLLDGLTQGLVSGTMACSSVVVAPVHIEIGYTRRNEKQDCKHLSQQVSI
ncbi:hypothetical protein ACR8GI_22155, partial [Salmonella enterica subsp. enterica serovar Paratyphi A]